VSVQTTRRRNNRPVGHKPVGHKPNLFPLHQRKGFPRKRIRLYRLDANSYRCSAGQHSHSTYPLFMLSTPFPSGRDSDYESGSWTWLSPFYKTPPFTRSSTRLHGQSSLHEHLSLVSVNKDLSIVTLLPVIERVRPCTSPGLHYLAIKER